MNWDIDATRISNPSRGMSFAKLIEQTLTRRKLLQGTLGLAAASFFGPGCSSEQKVDSQQPIPTDAEPLLGFKAVKTHSDDKVAVPEGYTHEAILPWGDPIDVMAPVWNGDASQGWEAQERQLGDNHDGMAFFGFNETGDGPGKRSDEGLLVLNHEYINIEYFYAPGDDLADWLAPFTLEKARKGLAGHGVSIVHLRREPNGTWKHLKDSNYNRRITGYTPIALDGSAAGDPLMRTEADPTGKWVLGTLNNCANGLTPWGTYLTCEENFNAYFGWNGQRDASALERRYGLNGNARGYRWHQVDPRFDLNATPNEPNRFGWVVEIDPFDPQRIPVKHTALGRFKHENAELVVAPDGRIVVYCGDDERNEYIYKFVSDGTFDRQNPYKREHRKLLQTGTLYVARFDAVQENGDQNGLWIPLIHGTNGLTDANGFKDQAEILIRARQAADRVGATMMDRPEWVAANPLRSGEIYCTLTNNDRRGKEPESVNPADGNGIATQAQPPIDGANPRAENWWGHIVRWQEAGGDPTALSFTWDIFVLAGNPGVYKDERAGSANVTVENMFNGPDGLSFDAFGRLWIMTDGRFGNSGPFAGQGNNQMLAADPRSGEIRRFLVGPSGCEITGLAFTTDHKTMFVNVQHPGEVGDHPRRPAGYRGPNWLARNPAAFSNWPSGVRPRSATVVVRRLDGGIIGA